jgi:hypothetical protein
MMHADRTNRTILALLGALLAAAGVAGILAGTPLFGADLPRRRLLDNPVSRFIGNESVWAWPVAASLALIAAIVVIRWLITILLSTDRISDIVVANEGSAGRTTLAAAALSDAVDTEIGAYHGVQSAQSRVLGSRTRPLLAVTVNADQSADLAALREGIEANAITHARHALDRADLPVQLDLTVSRRHGSRVI